MHVRFWGSGYLIMRIGIIGTGRIAKRAVKEIVRVRGLALTAVFNPNLEHADEFASWIEGEVPEVADIIEHHQEYSSYPLPKKLLASDNIDEF